MAAQLFGTDGVRGVAGDLLTAELAVALGRAATAECAAPAPAGAADPRHARVGADARVRRSRPGIAAAGGDALIGGVLPTPAASVLVRRLGLDLAAVISASHNPWRDNGIKFFGADGAQARSRRRGADRGRGRRVGVAHGRRRRSAACAPLEGGLDDYLRELERKFTLDLSGRRIVLDCANGATHRAAPAIFTRLGADVVTLGDEPDGRNINDGCGSTHPEPLAERVVAEGAVDRFRLRRRRRPADRGRRGRRGPRRRRGDRADRHPSRRRRHGSTAASP